MSDITITQDAKALFGALDKLVESLRHLDVNGEIGRLEDYDDAKAEAEIMLQALDGDYADD